jgi:hypothetical protein
MMLGLWKEYSESEVLRVVPWHYIMAAFIIQLFIGLEELGRRNFTNSYQNAVLLLSCAPIVSFVLPTTSRQMTWSGILRSLFVES